MRVSKTTSTPIEITCIPIILPVRATQRHADCANAARKSRIKEQQTCNYFARRFVATSRAKVLKHQSHPSFIFEWKHPGNHQAEDSNQVNVLPWPHKATVQQEHLDHTRHVWLVM